MVLMVWAACLLVVGFAGGAAAAWWWLAMVGRDADRAEWDALARRDREALR